MSFSTMPIKEFKKLSSGLASLDDRVEALEDLACCLLNLAADAGMPDSYWDSDVRISKACFILDLEPDEAYRRATS